MIKPSQKVTLQNKNTQKRLSVRRALRWSAAERQSRQQFEFHNSFYKMFEKRKSKNQILKLWKLRRVERDMYV